MPFIFHISLRHVASQLTNTLPSFKPRNISYLIFILIHIYLSYPPSHHQRSLFIGNTLVSLLLVAPDSQPAKMPFFGIRAFKPFRSEAWTTLQESREEKTTLPPPKRTAQIKSIFFLCFKPLNPNRLVHELGPL